MSMKLNRKELKKIMYNFNSVCNRLLQCDFNDYTSTLKKFLSFLKATPVIYEYILDCGDCEWEISQAYIEIRSFNGAPFSYGDTNEEEVRNIFALLDYIAENDIQVQYGIGLAYSRSNKYQDAVKAFNERVVMILIQHIENYLTCIGIDMGLEEKTEFSITLHDGQVNIASDNASLTASSTIETREGDLEELIKNVRDHTDGLKKDEAEMVEDNLKLIQEEVKSPAPKKNIIKAAISALKTIKEPAELAAAIVALIQFIQSILS